ncbi:hypothetical protein DI09_25p70 [Mitosporidium daphniae]|uniref:RING-type domain-containing protein n=1 Tax=Mitosporidium daphniae TaxID=1485682 RepID=A0A098VS90_9MICR|nr:uncharacterized protein DI09_25p70 [Mitosporidium daphniae]KGG51847.1 hypothetical protein DI09_25p70 [Mitosporidium daphniae]|eukprot:XP_013238301.1 uncharacterized protein DI09_25p70 [Mitosporidium daphniae]
MDAVPIISAISSSFSGISQVDSESTLDFVNGPENEDNNDDEHSDGNVVGELIPFSPLDGCEPLEQSIFTTTSANNNVSTKILFSPSEQNSKIVVLMEMSGNCSIDRKLMMAQRIPSVVGIILIGPILPTDQDILLKGIKSRLVVFSVATGIGETLLSLTNWYRQHRILPVPPGGLPTLNNSSPTMTASNVTSFAAVSDSAPVNHSQDDAWLRATLVTGLDASRNLGVLEFALLVVVVLLAVSFITSIVLHFYFFHSRGHQQGQGGNTETGFQQQQVLPEAYLRYLPIRVYGDLENVQSGLRKRSSTPDDAVFLNTHSGVDDGSQSSAPITLESRIQNTSTTINIVDINSNIDNPIENGQRIRSTSTSRSGTTSAGNNSAATVASPAPSVRSTSSWLMKTIRSSLYYFSSGKPTSPILFNDMCPICIEDFSIKSKVRELPCQHIFHPECIDAWLVNRASSCPMCKFDCYNSLKRALEEKELNDNTCTEDQNVERLANRYQVKIFCPALRCQAKKRSYEEKDHDLLYQFLIVKNSSIPISELRSAIKDRFSSLYAPDRTPDHYDMCDEDVLSEVLGDQSTILVITDQTDPCAGPVSSKKQRNSYSSDEAEIEDLISKFSPIQSDSDAHDPFPHLGGASVNFHQETEDEEIETIVAPALSSTSSADMEDEEEDDDDLEEESLSITESLGESDEVDSAPDGPPLNMPATKIAATANFKQQHPSDEEKKPNLIKQTHTIVGEEAKNKAAVVQKYGHPNANHHKKHSESESSEDDTSDTDTSESGSSDDQIPGGACAPKSQNNVATRPPAPAKSDSGESSSEEESSSSSSSEDDDKRFKNVIFSQPLSAIPQRLEDASKRNHLPLDSRPLATKQDLSFSSDSSSGQEEDGHGGTPSKSRIEDCFKNVPSLSSIFVEDLNKKSDEKLTPPIAITSPKLTTSRVLTQSAAPSAASALPSVASNTPAIPDESVAGSKANAASRNRRASIRKRN